MDFSRRRFLSGSAATVGALGVAVSPLNSAMIQENLDLLGKEPRFRGKLAIMQGLTTESKAQFIVLVESAKPYSYQVLDPDRRLMPVAQTRRETRAFSKWGIEKFIAEDLKPGLSYVLQVIDSSTGNLIDERSFSSVDTKTAGGSFVLASCMKDSKVQGREVMWDAVADSKPDYVFLIGDTCYADQGLSSESEQGYWSRYAETRSLLSHFRQKKLTPTLATWDDHDFGGNGYDGSFTKKALVRDIFNIFWGNEVPDGVEKGPGISQVVSLFGQRFFLMDSRYYRSSREGSGPLSHWGREQEDFLFSQLQTGKDPAWLLNGSQFFGGYLRKDSFEYKHGRNLKDVCRELSKFESPIAFASGDVHFSEIMRIEPEILGYRTFEFTSSSIHSSSFFGMHWVTWNPRRICATSSHNFVRIQSANHESKGWSIRAQSFGKNLKKHFERDVLIRR